MKKVLITGANRGLGLEFVLTDMTAESPVKPTVHPPESVSGMIARIETLTLHETGWFFNRRGEECDWFVEY